MEAKIIFKIIKSKIEKDEKLSRVHLNCKKDKIEIGGNELKPRDYNFLLYSFGDEYPYTMFTRIAIRNILTAFAIKNTIETKNNYSKNKNNNSCPWYDKYEVDNKGKILKSIYNIFVLFENDPRFKGKFSINESTGYETYNNKYIEEYNRADFLRICEKELGFSDELQINQVIQLLANKELYDLISVKV